jgi:hypothetical protein
MEKENTFPVGLDEKLFLELWCNSLLPKPQVIADLILKSFPFAMPSDRPALVSVLVVQVVEASLRLVAVNSALADRSKSVALNLLKPLPSQSDWEEFVQSVENLDPVQILAHLNVGEEALPSAELLCSQSGFSFISQMISVVGSGEVVFIPQRDNANVVFSLDGNAISVSTDELDVVSLADLTADLSSVAKGFLSAYMQARSDVYQNE